MAKKKSEVVNVIINSEKEVERLKSYAKIFIVLNNKDDSPEICHSYKQWGHVKDKVNQDGMPYIKYINRKSYIFEEAYWDNFGLLTEEQFKARNRVYEVIQWMRNNIENGNLFYVNIEESHKEK